MIETLKRNITNILQKLRNRYHKNPFFTVGFIGIIASIVIFFIAELKNVSIFVLLIFYAILSFGFPYREFLHQLPTKAKVKGFIKYNYVKIVFSFKKSYYNLPNWTLPATLIIIPLLIIILWIMSLNPKLAGG